MCDAAGQSFEEECGPEIGASCTAFEDKVVECFGESEEDPALDCQFDINDGVEDYGEACGQAYEDYYVCLTGLECGDIDSPDACAEEQAATDEACV